jgi:WhiB family transcriptional regulator, redox-sensing transcriptional regulator
MRNVNGADGDWRQSAACADHPDLFFPIGTTGTALVQLEQARRVCQSCQVRSACLEWALTTGADHGVWGGLSEEERRALRRRDRRPPTAPIPGTSRHSP